MVYYLIQTEDEKTINWASCFGAEIALKAVKGSAVWFLLKSIKGCFSKKCEGIIFRYLNDYPSFARTLLRTLLELFVLVLSFISNTKIYWICHNIDKETHTIHPYLNSIRRRVLTHFSYKVFVTDYFFIKKAEEILNVNGKVFPISFGKKAVSGPTSKNHNEIIKNWVDDKRNKGCNVLIWCAGSYADKTLHFSHLTKLMSILRLQGFKPATFVACHSLPSKIKNGLFDEDVRVFEERFSYDESFILNLFDFNFKIYDDLSMPYSIYASVEMQLPIITRTGDILSDIVKGEGIGITCDFERVLSFDKPEFERFLDKRIPQDKVQTFFLKRHWGTLFDELCR